MINIITIIFVCLTTFSWNSNGSNDKKSYKLEYNLAKGTHFIFTYIRDDHYEYEFMGNPSIINTNDKFEYSFMVEENSSDKLKYLVTYNNITIKTDNPQVTSIPDYSDLIGEKISAVITKKGKIVKLDGFSDLPELTMPGKGLMNAEKYTNAFRMLFPELPEENVSLGETWTGSRYFEEHDSGGLFKIRINDRYKLIDEIKSNEKTCLKIINNYVFDITGTGDLQGMAFIAKITGTGKDTILFDHNQNMLINIAGESEIRGSLEIDEEDVKMSLPMYHKYKETYIIEIK